MTFRERYEHNRIRDREMWFLRFVLGWNLGLIAAEFGLSSAYVRIRIARSASYSVKQRHAAPDPIPDWWRRLAAAGAIPRSWQDDRRDCFRHMDELAQPPRLDPIAKLP